MGEVCASSHTEQHGGAFLSLRGFLSNWENVKFWNHTAYELIHREEMENYGDIWESIRSSKVFYFVQRLSFEDTHHLLKPFLNTLLPQSSRKIELVANRKWPLGKISKLKKTQHGKITEQLLFHSKSIHRKI